MPTSKLKRAGRLTSQGRERVQIIKTRGLPPGADTKALHDKLLSIAGDIAIIITVDPDAKKIVERGIFLLGDSVLVEGEARQCHANSARLWLESKETEPGRYSLFTGYSFSWDDDGVGCWRQHSWVLDTTSRLVVETTTPRDGYFGFELTEAEAVEFARLNI